MKKAFKYVAYAMMFLAPSMGFVACSDDDSSESNNINKKEKVADDPLSPEEQKERLEQAALDLAAELPAEDFEDVIAFGKYVYQNCVRNCDWDDVEDWVEDTFVDLVDVTTLKETTETTKDEFPGYIDVYNDIYSNYKVVVAASNFTGEFTAIDGEWVKTNDEEMDYLCFNFTDEEGEDCSLTLETSGKTTPLYIGQKKEWVDDDYDEDYNEKTGKTIYTYYDYYEQFAITAKVPEHVVVTLTQAGVIVAQLNLDIALSGLSDNVFNLASSNFTAACTLSFPTAGPGYTIGFTKLAYSGNKKASVALSLTKEEETLLSIAVAGDVSGLPSYKLGVSKGKPDVSNVNGKNIVAEVDVMGQVQLYGTLTNVTSFIQTISNAKKNRADEANFKKYMKQANDMMSVGLFYDGEESRHASLQFAGFKEEEGNKWEMVPTIYFYYDESSYAIGDFFNKDDFEAVITTYKDMAEEYIGLILK